MKKLRKYQKKKLTADEKNAVMTDKEEPEKALCNGLIFFKIPTHLKTCFITGSLPLFFLHLTGHKTNITLKDMPKLEPSID